MLGVHGENIVRMRIVPRLVCWAVWLAVPMVAPKFAPAQSALQTIAPDSRPLQLVSYSGNLPHSVLTSGTGVYGITFALYREQTGGVPLWLEHRNVFVDENGRYTVLLGATTSGLPAHLFSSDEQRWLSVQNQGEPEQPRLLLASVPYAVKALEAETLGGHTANEFVTTESLQTAVQQQVQQQHLWPPTARQPQYRPYGAAGVTKDLGSLDLFPASDFVDSTGDQIVLVQQLGGGVGLNATSVQNSAILGNLNSAPPLNVTAGVEGISSLAGASAPTDWRPPARLLCRELAPTENRTVRMEPA